LAEDSSQDKELDPTAQRLQKAREEGQFAQSRDITTFALITGFLLFVIVLGPLLFRQMVTMVDLALRFNQPIRLIDHVSDWGSGPFTILALTIAMVMVPIWLIAIIAPLALAGFRPVFALKFAPDKLDPIAGIGRMFSTNSLIELGKNLIKILLILGVGFAYLYGLFAYVKSIIAGDFSSSILITTDFIINGITLLLIPLAVIALLDGTLQWYQFRKQMKMSPEEVKQETKESEGSPEIKSRLRQKQRQIANSRMMAAIERADVVLANPEHYSVAIRYDPEKMSAPIVVARGIDSVALRIQEVAKEHNVPVAQIPPLARYLYSQLDIGEQIPMPLFEAVAKILAWAYEVKENDGRTPVLPEVFFTPEQIKKNRAVL
jgi:flagellar biosynthetic protein FlhB